MYRFGSASRKRLATCHYDMQVIMNKVIELSDVDFGIAEGYRTVEKQKEYFDAGKSKIDGVTRKGKHNYSPSLAVDIYPYFKRKAQWDNEHLSYLSGMVHAVAEILYMEGKIEHKIRWGGNWDMDGIILIDQGFDDRPHFELIKA